VWNAFGPVITEQPIDGFILGKQGDDRLYTYSPCQGFSLLRENSRTGRDVYESSSNYDRLRKTERYRASYVVALQTYAYSRDWRIVS
jgi:hypothetical protein